MKMKRNAGYPTLLNLRLSPLSSRLFFLDFNAYILL